MNTHNPQNGILRGLALIVSALALFAGLAGCGKVSDKLSEKASEKITEKAIEASSGGKADVDIKDGEVSIETEDGSLKIGTGDLPDNWPKDVPLPDDIKIAGSYGSSDTSSGEIVTVSAQTDLSADEVISFYNDKLGDWSESSNFSTSSDGGKLSSISLEKDNRTISISATEDSDNETLLTISHITKPSE